MATLVAVHAHPDDECIMQSGTLARASDAGHRVVIVYATGGEAGEVPDGFLEPGETLFERRRAEALRSADVLGVSRVVWLGYRDSGMMGTPENDDPSCFWRADVEEAAGRVAAVLDEERADVVTIYDPHGMYGHPDHIQVHRVGARAAGLAGTPHVLQLTLNRDHVRRLLAAMELEDEPDVPDLDDPAVPFGVPEAEITTVVDVRAWIDRKRASMAAHGSQTGDTAPFLAMPDDVLADALGREWYVRHGVPAGHRDDDVFAGVAGSPDGDGTGGGAGAGSRAGAGAQVAGQARTPDQ